MEGRGTLRGWTKDQSLDGVRKVLGEAFPEPQLQPSHALLLPKQGWARASEQGTHLTGAWPLTTTKDTLCDLFISEN